MYGDTGILVQWGFNDRSDDHYLSVVCWSAGRVAVADIVFHPLEDDLNAGVAFDQPKMRANLFKKSSHWTLQRKN